MMQVSGRGFEWHSASEWTSAVSSGNSLLKLEKGMCTLRLGWIKSDKHAARCRELKHLPVTAIVGSGLRRHSNRHLPRGSGYGLQAQREVDTEKYAFEQTGR